MPSLKLFTAAGKTPAEKQALIQAVAKAFSDTIVGKGRNLAAALVEVPEEGIVVPGEAKPSEYMIVEIDMFPGRSLDEKRNLYRAINQAILDCGFSTAALKIYLREPPLENWGIARGQMASEFMKKMQESGGKK